MTYNKKHCSPHAMKMNKGSCLNRKLLEKLALILIASCIKSLSDQEIKQVVKEQS